MADEPLTMTEREEARERLRASIDALSEQANLHAQLQKDPLKMLGGASAVGAVLGLVVGRQFRRRRKIYVDASSPVKHQKALIKAQTGKSGGGGVGGALIATLGTLAIKTLSDKVITPRLEGYANGLLERSGQAPRPGAGAASFAAPRPVAQTMTPGSSPLVSPARAAAPASSSTTPVTTNPVPATAPALTVAAAAAPATTHPGVLPHPPSVVEAKAQGSVIDPDQMANPNRR